MVGMDVERKGEHSEQISEHTRMQRLLIRGTSKQETSAMS